MFVTEDSKRLWRGSVSNEASSLVERRTLLTGCRSMEITNNTNRSTLELRMNWRRHCKRNVLALVRMLVAFSGYRAADTVRTFLLNAEAWPA